MTRELRVRRIDQASAVRSHGNNEATEPAHAAPLSAPSRYGRYQRAPTARPVEGDGESPGISVSAADATRDALVMAAHTLFGEAGYEATALGDVARLAGVTRGALYYHYAGKEALFEAVYRTVQATLRASAVSAFRMEPSTQANSLRLRAGLREYLRRATESSVRRIVFGDGMAVLGWQRCRSIDREYCVGALLDGLNLAGTDGPSDDDAASTRRAYLVAAALREAALLIGNAADCALIATQVEPLVDRILDAILSRDWSMSAGEGGS